MLFGRALAVLAALATVSGCAREAAVNSEPHTGTGVASTVDGMQQVVLRTGVDLRFHPSTIIVRPGKVRLVLENTAKPGAGPPHNLHVGGLPGADIADVQAGFSASVTFTAPEPGTYDFVCTIHASQGQTGKLIVR
jgi:plastocyanin